MSSPDRIVGPRPEAGFDPRLARLSVPVLTAVAAVGRHHHGRPAVVLIDGPSGAGKSTLADAVLAAWSGPLTPTLVRLDDIYPGWGGLDAAVEHLGAHLLRPRHDGETAAWRRHDWVTGRSAEWHSVDPARPLLVEGCGALAAAHAGWSDVRVWLDADDGIRKQRALDRDGEVFESHWDQWQRDWDRYRARERPENWATVRLTATPGPVGPGGSTPNPGHRSKLDV